MTHMSDTAPVHYDGENGPAFWLAFKTGLLTLLTLGIYRFWQKTRIRRYVWSSAHMGGDRFEYTGTGLEKFLGFLIAVVFLAVYLGLIQLALFYFGLNVFVDPETATPQQVIAQVVAIYVSFFALIPFILFAVYRARRYKMARTRWRGIRFGMDKGAWGYVWRAIAHGLLTILTLGILLPRQTFYLEKYMTDRSHYGDARFVQEGRWTHLYDAMRHVFFGLALLLGAALAGVLGVPALAGVLGVVGYVWILVGFVHYGVQSFGYLTRHKRLGDVQFDARPRTGRVIGIYILGTVALGLLIGLAFGALFGIGFGSFVALGDPAQVEAGGAVFATIAVLVVAYLVILVLAQALSLILITQPILQHYVETIAVVNPQALDSIHQRAAETGVDAEGFADALDVGGAI